MKDLSLKIMIVLILLGIPLFTAFSLDSGSLPHTGLQGIFFVILSFFEALGFEAGVVSLFLVLPTINQKPLPLKKHLKMVYFPLLWLLMSWWPHDYAHAHNTIGTWGLLYIEYAFHLTSILAAALAVYGFSFLIDDFSGK